MRYSAYFKETVSYWERRRLIYNGVLVVLAAACWGADILAGGPRDWLGGGLVLLIFASIANALYCLAYPVDLVFQIPLLKPAVKYLRGALFVTGTAIAMALALWVMLGTGMA